MCLWAALRAVSRRMRGFAGAGTRVGVALAGVHCSGNDLASDAEVDAKLVGNATSALTVSDVTWINGTYGTCLNRSVGGNWSLRVSGAAAMDYGALSVVKKDSGCVLTVTSVVASGVTYTATPTLALGTSYAATASAFQAPMSASVYFYGNAKLSSTTFASNVTLSLLMSDSPAAGAVGITAREPHYVKGTVAGLQGSGLTLYDNGGDALTIAENGAFTFATKVAYNATYTVTVATQPTGPTQTCAVTGNGTMGHADANVTVSCVAAPYNVWAGSSIVTTFSGHPYDGPPSSALFASASGITADSSGTLYVADRSSYRIRKITPAGAVFTLAGSGVAGAANGTGPAASFDNPYGVAVDGSGNVYVADKNNHAVRKIASSGVVTTLAGGTQGSADGTGTAANLSFPEGIAVDGSGNLYVTETGNHNIRKVTAAGVVTTLAGSGAAGYADGTGTAASFSFPQGIAVDGSGNIYVADSGNKRIRMVTPAGVVTTLAGSGLSSSLDGTGTAATFNTPFGCAIDGSGNVYVTDFGEGSLRRVTPAGVVTTVVSGLSSPLYVAVTSSGNLYVTASTVVKVSSGVASAFAGTTSTAFADGAPNVSTFSGGGQLAFDSSNTLYVTDNNRLRKITTAGVVSTLAGSGAASSVDGSGTAASFNSPQGVVVDGSGNVFVSDSAGYVIRKVTAAGVVTTFAGSGTSGSNDATGTAATFTAPRGLALDGTGKLYVADHVTIRKITSTAVVTTLAGSTAGLVNNTGTAAKFRAVYGVTVDGSGNLYIGDSTNDAIRKVTSAGVVTTLAGGSGSSGRVDGTGTAALFYRPRQTVVDGSGNVYVSESLNYDIRKVTAARVTTTIAGGLAQGFADGPANSSLFGTCTGIARDSFGSLFVLDSTSNLIRKIVVASSGQLSVGWSLGYDSDFSIIQNYSVTATSPGEPTGTCSIANGATSCLLTGLTSAATYTVTVTATGASGTSVPAPAITAVVP